MNRNHLVGFAVTAAVLGLLAFAAWFFLEIYPATKPVPPSREARVNEYLALDRWLESMGRPVRSKSSGDLSMIFQAEEKQIFIQTSLFRWTDEAVEYLVRWIEEGGHLFLVVDNYEDWEYWSDEAPLALLEEFEITIKAETGLPRYQSDNDAPSFARDVSFEVFSESSREVLQAEGALVLKDRTGLARLVQVKRGMGRLTVTGQPLFLLSQYLGDAPNARLAWTLFAEYTPANPASNFASNSAPALTPKFSPDNKMVNSSEEGWLFIRGSARIHGLLGNLFRQGNLTVLLVSVLILLVVGFWTVIPVFGLVRPDDERSGKPLRERFLAEGRFLKRYGALGFYRDTYVREIRRRLAHNEGLFTDDKTMDDVIKDDVVIRRLLHILGKTGEERESQMFVRALRGDPFTYREFPKMIVIFKTILDRI